MEAEHPTWQQLEQFFRRSRTVEGVEQLERVFDEGEITKTSWSRFVEDPDRFPNRFHIAVDRRLTLKEMIRAGSYDLVDGGFDRYFALGESGYSEHEVRLLNHALGLPAQTVEVRKQLRDRHYQLPKIEHLLAYGSKYPDKQRKFPIIALGSSVVRNGFRFLPCLDAAEQKGQLLRRLCLVWEGTQWPSHCRFLALAG